MSKFDFKGVTTALVTPFKNQRVDEDSFRRVIQSQLKAGIQGFVVNGTTGESPSLKWSEVKRLFELAREETQGKVPLFLGTGSNSTAKTIEMTQEAEKWGADAALVVTPYYNKPPQRGLVAHFKSVAENTGLPVMLYNVPGRTITSLSIDTIAELSGVSNIFGIKEATGDIEFGKKVIAATPDDFVVVSGDDGTAVELCYEGGDGVISVTSHVYPEAMVTFVRRAREKDAAAVQEYKVWDSLCQQLFAEANPIPVKMALHLMGLIDSAELRLPLVELSPAHTQELRAAMREADLL